MFAKIFSQIFDSSIADHRPLRHFFMDMLVLADPNGVVDMTPNAIAKRTGWPLEEVLAHLATLEQPDPQSRTPDHDGARLARLDSHRSWGWVILNYQTFREIASEQQRRSGTLARVRKFREKSSNSASVTHGNAPVTPSNACNAMQKQKQMHKQKDIRQGTAFQKPSLDEVKLAMEKAGLPEKEAIKFFNHYESNGWRVGKNPMKSFPHAVGNWAVNFHERTYQPGLPAGTGPSLTQKIIDNL